MLCKLLPLKVLMLIWTLKISTKKKKGGFKLKIAEVLANLKHQVWDVFK